MKTNLFGKTLLLLSVLFAGGLTVVGQTVNFCDDNVDYVFDIPNQTWRITSRPSVASPNVELVYGDRMNGLMEIRKLGSRPDELMAEVIEKEEEKLKFLQGYVRGTEENFAGFLRGSVFNFEFIRSGRNMSGRYYFLRADPSTVYVIRFSGLKDQLMSIRNQTDMIARTFNIRDKDRKDCRQLMRDR
jgi:hypothetical protein